MTSKPRTRQRKYEDFLRHLTSQQLENLQITVGGKLKTNKITDENLKLLKPNERKRYSTLNKENRKSKDFLRPLSSQQLKNLQITIGGKAKTKKITDENLKLLKPNERTRYSKLSKPFDKNNENRIIAKMNLIKSKNIKNLNLRKSNGTPFTTQNISELRYEPNRFRHGKARTWFGIPIPFLRYNSLSNEQKRMLRERFDTMGYFDSGFRHASAFPGRVATAVVNYAKPVVKERAIKYAVDTYKEPLVRAVKQGALTLATALVAKSVLGNPRTRSQRKRSV